MVFHQVAFMLFRLVIMERIAIRFYREDGLFAHPIDDKFNLESYKNGGTGKPAVRRAFLKKMPLLRSLKQMQMAHINETQRYTIYRMRKDKKTQREIARAIGVSQAAVSKELKRNRCSNGRSSGISRWTSYRTARTSSSP